MQITRTETNRTTETTGTDMSIKNFERSVSTIGNAVLVQSALKYAVIAFLGWLTISSIDQWIISATS